MTASGQGAGMDRFYKRADIRCSNDIYALELDGRIARTRAGNILGTQKKSLANKVAQEWNDQGEKINLANMPYTGLLSTIIDLGEKEQEIWRARILDYLNADLLCYRVDAPAKLVALQTEKWDPPLAMLAARGVILKVTNGISHIAQPRQTVDHASALLAEIDCMALLPLRIITEILGSAGLAICVYTEDITPSDAFALSRVDEEFQIEAWGHDAEAAERVNRQRTDYDAAIGFLALSKVE